MNKKCERAVVAAVAASMLTLSAMPAVAADSGSGEGCNQSNSGSPIIMINVVVASCNHANAIDVDSYFP